MPYNSPYSSKVPAYKAPKGIDLDQLMSIAAQRMRQEDEQEFLAPYKDAELASRIEDIKTKQAKAEESEMQSRALYGVPKKVILEEQKYFQDTGNRQGPRTRGFMKFQENPMPMADQNTVSRYAQMNAAKVRSEQDASLKTNQERRRMLEDRRKTALAYISTFKSEPSIPGVPRSERAAKQAAELQYYKQELADVTELLKMPNYQLPNNPYIESHPKAKFRGGNWVDIGPDGKYRKLYPLDSDSPKPTGLDPSQFLMNAGKDEEGVEY